MKFAMALPTKGPLSTPEHLTKLSEEAEKLNFYSLCLSDHVVIPDVIDSKYPYAEKGGAPKKFFAGDYLEQLTTLAFVAGKNLVPSPATGKITFFKIFMCKLLINSAKLYT